MRETFPYTYTKPNQKQVGPLSFLTPLIFIILIGSLIAYALYTDYAEDRGYIEGYPEEANVVNKGNGVYYFNCCCLEFDKEITNFAKDHEIVTIAPNDVSGYGSALGYWVIVKQNVER
jgi:hypothetical protein